MNWTQYIARVAVRRVVVVVVILFLGWVGIGRSEAQVTSRQDAYEQCTAEAARTASDRGTQPMECVHAGTKPSFHYQCYVEWAPGSGNPTSCGSLGNYRNTFPYNYADECPSGLAWNDAMKQCGQDCAAMPESVGGFTPPNGSFACAPNGCRVGYYYNGDGTSTRAPTGAQCKPGVGEDMDACSAVSDSFYWNQTLNVCSPKQKEDCEPGVTPTEGQCNAPEKCPAGMITDANGQCAPEAPECPAGNIKSPEGSCLPGEGQCAAGEVRGKDGTCKKDVDGDGEPDEHEDGAKSEFSGGDDCNTPPTCSGDAIMCGQARIQWRIECNTRRNVNISGGSCSHEPLCVGENCNAMEYAQLLQQWRTSCAVQKLLDKEGGGTDGGQPAWTRVDGMSQDAGQGATEGDTDVWADGDVIDGSTLNKAGWVGGGGTCPSFGFAAGSGEYSNAFMTHIANPPPMWCQMITWIYAFVLLSATVTGIYILGGRS